MAKNIYYLFVGALILNFVIADEEDQYCDRGDGFRIKEGTSKPDPTGCALHTCTKDTHNVVTVICGKFVARPGCRESEHDYSKRYPHCCPKEICD